MSNFKFILVFHVCWVFEVVNSRISLQKEGRKAHHPFDPDEGYTEPHSGQRIRLSHYGDHIRTPNAGLVEVYRAGKWGVVCDDSWDIEDATVACRQLGFKYGAEHALRGGRFSTGSWNSSSFLMDDVDCNGDESALHHCHYNDHHNCRISEAASVVCRTNIGCGDSWIAGPVSCYSFPQKPKRSVKKAQKRCIKAGGYLTTVENIVENDFLSNVLKNLFPDRHEWLVSGQKMPEGEWTWVKYSKRLLHHAHTTRRNKSGRLRKMHRHRKSHISVEKSPITANRWFPGWMPRHFGKEPASRGIQDCLILTDRLRHPNGSDVTVSYMFWKAVECSSVNGWNYICEKPVSLGFDSDGQSLECYHGNGEDYRGNKDTTSAGFPCQEWTLSDDINPDKYPDKGLGNHSYCRNPDGDQEPWCFTNAELEEFAYCSVPRCQEDNSTSNREQDNPVRECPPGKFHCHLDNRGACIKDMFKCDREMDCPNGEDEISCEYFLPRFTVMENVRLITTEVARYGVIPLEMCAKFCAEYPDNGCQSFSYRKPYKYCYLSGERPTDLGPRAVVADISYDTYELSYIVNNKTEIRLN